MIYHRNYFVGFTHCATAPFLTLQILTNYNSRNISSKTKFLSIDD